jgi:acetylornithine deacetylase/succinyl-diaminopimelate desuccinylase-like protein
MMMYGHLDKQPYGPGWDEDKQPTVPVIINNRMYGRGGADDGYSAFSCMLALKSCQE